MEKTKFVDSLKVQVDEKQKLVERYTADRAKLIPKNSGKQALRLANLVAAAEQALAQTSAISPISRFR